MRDLGSQQSKGLDALDRYATCASVNQGLENTGTAGVVYDDYGGWKSMGNAHDYKGRSEHTWIRPIL